MFLSSKHDYTSSLSNASVTPVSPTGAVSQRIQSVQQAQAGILEARVTLPARHIIQASDLLRRKTENNGHAYNPITGPFNDQSELIGRVTARETLAGTVITGEHLVELSPIQQQNTLRRFWARCH